MKKLITIILVLVGTHVFAQRCTPNTNSLNLSGPAGNYNFTKYASLNSQTNLNMTDVVTVEAWVYADSFATGSALNSIFCKHGWSNYESGYVLRAGGNGILSFNICGDSLGLGISRHWKEVLSPPGTLTKHTWNHVAGTFDGTHQKIYVNGILVGDTLFNGTIRPSTFNPRIGVMADNGFATQRFWSGKIDEVRVFHRALSQAEIHDSMSVQITPSAQNGLVGYWRLNNGTGTTFNDLSTSNNSGTLTAAGWSASVPFNDAPAKSIVTPGPNYLMSSITTNIQWYMNGTILLPGDTLPIYTPLVVGALYTVEVTNALGCTSFSDPFTFVGINENSLEQFVSISPNPAHDFLSLNFRNQEVIRQVEITDVEGRSVYFKSGINTVELRIPVDRYAKGIYFAKFYGKDSVLTKKFVVQ